MSDLGDEYPTPFSDPAGWVSTDTFRERRNPRRTFYNALWEPKYLIQQLFLKTIPGCDPLGKWVGPGIEEDAQI